MRSHYWSLPAKNVILAKAVLLRALLSKLEKWSSRKEKKLVRENTSQIKSPVQKTEDNSE